MAMTGKELRVRALELALNQTGHFASDSTSAADDAVRVAQTFYEFLQRGD
jgi:hypothetical protein